MELLVARSCFERLAVELERVSPAEGLLVPLLALDRAAPGQAPWASVGLPALARLVLARVLLLPAGGQENRLFEVRALPGSDRLLDAQVAAEIRQHPRLRACAYLHSHPFARGTTWPSGTDLHGHLEPLLDRNRAAGLEAAFSLIACRPSWGPGWRLEAFALSAGGLARMGAFQPVPDVHPAVQAALAPPLVRRAGFRRTLRRAAGWLRRSGRDLQVDRLFDGWSRWVVRLSDLARLVLLLPDDLGRRPARLWALPGAGVRAVPLESPQGWPEAPAAWRTLLEAAEEATHVQRVP